MTPKTFLLLLGCTLTTASAQIQADVTTSMGLYTIELNYTAAPRAVANFITLAEGTRPWVDSSSGAVRTSVPYYNGISYHRVISGFMSQTGSRKGDGTDGPGYTFRDEFSAGLTHTGPYVVSMANSGPNTNGSQIFITASSQSQLNGVHTIFGAVVAGQSVCDAINTTPVTGSVPVTPVTIQSIVIRRTGTAAIAFDPFAQGLPIVHSTAGNLLVNPGTSATWSATTPAPAGDVFRAFRTSTLSTWAELYTAEANLGLDHPGQTSFLLDAAPGTRGFYNLSLASHPAVTAFSSLAGRTVETDNHGDTMKFVFNATASGGTMQYIPAGGSPINATFTTNSSDFSPYQFNFIAITSLNYGSIPFYPWIKCGWDTIAPATVAGHHYTSYWTGSTWADFDKGTCSVNR